MIVETDNFNSKMVLHDLINRNYGKHIPHEWYFTKVLIRHFKDPIIAKEFVAFWEQYHPEYRWKYRNWYNLQDMATFETSRNEFILKCVYQYNDSDYKDGLEQAIEFGNIATEFCIRYLNYSLIDVSGTKSILTAQSNCDKKFEEFLEKGYSLYRLKKIDYRPNKHDIFGRFIELPILPTRNLYYNNEEFIKYDDNKPFIKVLKN